MKSIFTFLFVFIFSFAIAQTTADFENFSLAPETHLDGSDGSGGYTSGNLFLPNDYNSNYGSWSGWAISNETDTITPGYLNDVSAMPFGGADGSSTFAVAFGQGEIKIHLEDDAQGGVVDGFHITNNSYVYHELLDPAFAKVFGGATGNDPDYFLLTIKKYLNGQLSTDSVNFYLADYRFTDNSMDYIVTDWVFVDLTSLGNVDSLSFQLSSTDNGMFGMNTPAYFCLDNFTTTDATSSNEVLNPLSFDIFPNPTSDFIRIKNVELEDARVSLFNLNGKLLLEKNISNFQDQIDIRNFPAGSYFIKIENEKGYHSQILIKE